MIKNYLVSGATWVAQVDITDTIMENLSPDDIHIEVATIAVEAYYKKRTDVVIVNHDPIEMSNEEMIQNEGQACIMELMADEIEKGCGIGVLLCVMDVTGPRQNDGEHEWYISSKLVLENAGMPRLANLYLQKHPDKV